MECKGIRIHPLQNRSCQQQWAGRFQHVDVLARIHPHAEVDDGIPERMSGRACHNTIEEEGCQPAPVGVMVPFRRFFAQDDPHLFRDRLQRRKASGVDIRIDATEPLEKAIACKIGTLDRPGVAIKKRKQIRKLAGHELPQGLIIPETVVPVRIETLPAPGVAFIRGDGMRLPGLVNDARNGPRKIR